jgi:hypothetical protein
MGFIAGINRIVQLFGDTLRQLFRGRIWLILLAYYGFQWLLLYAHEQFASPMFSWLVSLTLSFKDVNRATAFTHYPSHYVFLPDVYGGVKFVVGLIFEGLALGAVAGIFLQKFAGRKSGISTRSAVKLWLQLAIVWLVLNGLTLVLSYVIPAALSSQLYSPKRMAVFSFIIMPATFTVCMALFYYSVPLIMAAGRNGFWTLGRAIKLFFKYPIMTLVLAAITVAGPVLVAAISSGYVTTIVDKFRPELVYWLLFFGLFVEMVASFVWMGVASRLVADELD